MASTAAKGPPLKPIQLLARMLGAADMRAVAAEHVSELSTEFFITSTTYLTMARREGNEAVAARLLSVLQSAWEVKLPQLSRPAQLLHKQVAGASFSPPKPTGKVLGKQPLPKKAREAAADRYPEPLELLHLLNVMTRDVERQPPSGSKVSHLARLRDATVKAAQALALGEQRAKPQQAAASKQQSLDAQGKQSGIAGGDLGQSAAAAAALPEAAAASGTESQSVSHPEPTTPDVGPASSDAALDTLSATTATATTTTTITSAVPAGTGTHAAAVLPSVESVPSEPSHTTSTSDEVQPTSTIQDSAAPEPTTEHPVAESASAPAADAVAAASDHTDSTATALPLPSESAAGGIEPPARPLTAAAADLAASDLTPPVTPAASSESGSPVAAGTTASDDLLPEPSSAVMEASITSTDNTPAPKKATGLAAPAAATAKPAAATAKPAAAPQLAWPALPVKRSGAVAPGGLGAPLLSKPARPVR
ncbi:MAG: hypothetical protein WDW38_008959 [Sanguina aurantia]